MNTPRLRCKNCRCIIREPNHRIKNQQYCTRKRCQRARKRKWQRLKMASDEDYRLNQKDAQAKWRRNNPGYFKRYRQNHPEYRKRNRELQKKRDARRRSKNLAKMDALSKVYNDNSIGYYIFPADSDLAKMDASFPIYRIIPAGCTHKNASCKKGLNGHDPPLELP